MVHLPSLQRSGVQRMKILAFDLGSTWACASNGAQVGLGMNVMHEVLTGNREQKLYGLLCSLHGLFDGSKECPWDMVIYERPFTRGLAATRMLWGMAGVLEAVATHHGLPTLDVLPSTIKLWAAGKGTAGKEDMIAAAFMLGYAAPNDHEADAYCLLKYAEANASVVTPKKGK